MADMRRTGVNLFFECSLLGLLASGYLALASSGSLDLPTCVLTGLALLLRGLMVSGWLPFSPAPRVVLAATLLYIGFYPLDYLFVSREFLPATVHLICFLASVRVLTAATNRDYFFVKVIAFLELLAATVFTASMSFLLFLTMFLVFAVMTFASAEVRRSLQTAALVHREARAVPLRLAALSLLLTIGILGMTGGLFFLLPRTARAALQRFVPPQYHLPGYSQEVTLGQVGRIEQRSAAVMRVRLSTDGSPPALKWRGGALLHFDGRRWTNPPIFGQMLSADKGQIRLTDPDTSAQYRGRRLFYEVQLQGAEMETLFFPGTPDTLRIGAAPVMRMPGDGYRVGMGTASGLRYQASSLLPNPTGSWQGKGVAGALPLPARRVNLELPALDARIPQLARDLTAATTDDAEKAHVIERYFQSKFGYTLDLLSTEVPDPLAYFLFERKKGHCEYFASAMAVLLRTLNIPARVATGFQSGIYNPLSGWQVIRAQDAHSWVEAYLPGYGWTTFDPTPPDLNPAGAPWWSRLALYADAAETFWQEWVLNYDLDQQLRVVATVEQSGRRFSWDWGQDWTWPKVEASPAEWRDVGLGSVGAITLASLLWWGTPWARRWLRVRRLARGGAASGEIALLYEQLLKTLRRRGWEKRPDMTPGEFAASLPTNHLGLAVREWTGTYEAVRYGGRVQEASRLVALLGQIERAR